MSANDDVAIEGCGRISVPESESELVGGIYRRESWTLRAAEKEPTCRCTLREFKQACLIDGGNFFSVAGLSFLFETVSCNTK